MSILWLIIKVTLLIMLIIFLCLAFILIFLLLAPIKYDCLYNHYETTSCCCKINLLRIIEMKWLLEEGVQESKIKLFGFIIYDKHIKDFEKVVENKAHQAANNTQHLSEEIVEETVHKKIGWQPFITQMITVKELFLDKRFSIFLKKTLTTLRRLLKCFKPYHIDFEFIVGKENPADTGELIAQITLLYPWYYKYGIIEGNYDEEGLWGSFSAKGKFNLISLVNIFIGFIINKEVREYIQLLLKIRKEN